jgi:hypothetical protein
MAFTSAFIFPIRIVQALFAVIVLGVLIYGMNPPLPTLTFGLLSNVSSRK